uniref:DNA helicase n=1 Tax=Panagrellus redivivus TaxID=6233 RepID=A0A7E4ZQJ2_PANRE
MCAYPELLEITTLSPELSSEAPENPYANDHTLFFRVFKGLINRLMASRSIVSSTYVFSTRVKSVLRRMKSDAPSRLKKGLQAKYSKEEVENFINDLESYLLSDRAQLLKALLEPLSSSKNNVEDVKNPSLYEQVQALISFGRNYSE